MDTNIPSNYTEMLTKMGIDNPKSLAIAQLMDQQQANQEAEAEPEVHPDMEKLKAENHRLRKAIKAMEALAFDFAGAVGACPDCWGEDQDCKTCEGHGSPGAGKIDQEAYSFFIAPLFGQMADHNYPNYQLKK
ncbi:MAG: hypothetical protein AB8F95_04565, partial [Bacteroidia bacterium]